MKKIQSSKMGFFAVAVMLLWIKSYLVYSFDFNLDIQNSIQHFLLFLNPLSSALIFLSIALFARGRKAGIWMITIYIFMNILLYSNVVFYRFNSDFITLPVLTQTSNFASLGGSIADLVAWTDLLYLIDIMILITVYRWSRKDWSIERIRLRKPLIIIAAGVIIFSVNSLVN